MSKPKLPNMMPNNQFRGKFGEDTAASFLQQKGYTIISRNFRGRFEEIDIIATHQKTLVFVEVKTRWGRAFGLAVEAITPRKIRILIKAAYHYKSLHPKLPEALRMDVVAVQLNEEGKLLSIDHIENITG